MSFLVFEVIDKWATCDMLAKASPLKPNVAIFCRSSNSVNFEVVNLSQTISKSSLCIPDPLSWI